MSQIQLQESCTFTANVIGTQLLFSIPDASSQPSGDEEIAVLDGGVQYIPLYVQDTLPNNVVGNYVINNSQQLSLVDQTRQLILTNDQIVALSQMSSVQQNGLSNAILSLQDSENTSNGQLETDKTVVAEASIIVEKDDIAHATNSVQVNIVDNVLVDPPDKTCPQACDTCGLRFESRKLFKKHVLSHLHDKPLNCPHCSESFNHQYNFIPHLATHNEKDPYCPVCNKSFNRLAGLKAHILIHQCDDTLPCPECLEEFSTQKLLDAHRLEHKTDFVKQLSPTHSCSHCDEKFAALSSLKEHVQDIHKVKIPRKIKKGKGGYVCEFCKKRFKKPSQLVRHRRTHTGEKPFKCAECGKGFGQKGSLQIHMLKHSGVRPYACTYCSSQFSQKGNLQAHIARIHPEESKKSTCKYCSSSFRNTQELDNHMSRYHGFAVAAKADKDVTYALFSESPATTTPPNSDSSNKENEAKEPPEVVDENPAVNSSESATKISGLEVVNKCKYCSEIFQKRTDLVKHLKFHAGDKKYKCICSRQFLTKATLKNHFQTCHLDSLKFHCDICLSKFAFEEDLERHKKLKHKATFECTQCNLIFDTLKESETHQETHNLSVEPEPSNIDSSDPNLTVLSEVPFECTKLLISSDGTIQFIRDVPMPEEKEEPSNEMIVSSLNEEIELENAAQDVIEEPTREMSDDKQKHKCDHCNLAFKQKSHWKMHLRIHTGEKPFVCEICDKAFVSKSALTVHLGTHSEVPAFKCDDCGRGFSTHRSLKRHTDLHVPGFMYSCSVCNRAYKTKVAWQKHLATHMKISREKDTSNDFKKQAEKSLPKVVSDGTKNSTVTSVLSLQIASVNEDDDERLKQDNPAFNGDWNTLIQSLLPGHELNLESIPFSTRTVALPTVKTTSTVVTEPQTPTPDVLRQVQFSDFGNKIQLFTSLNDESFDGCVFLQNSEEDLSTRGETLEALRETQSTSNTHHCSLCDHSFDNLVELSIHKTTHLRDKWTTCANCNASCDSSQQLQEHMKTCRVEQRSNMEQQNVPRNGSTQEYIPPSKLQKCTKCNVYYNAEDYLAHMNQHHKTICTKPSTQLLTQVVEDNVEKKAPNSSRERLEIKRKKAAWKRQTIRTLTEEEKLIVMKENPNSISEKILRQSIIRQQVTSEKETPKETETPEYPNQCKYCPKSFRKPSDLVRHLRVHTGERPYMCTSCNKSFSIKSTAKSHVKIHKKERLYKCHICHNCFAAVGSLKVHMRLHIGAKPFGCELCPARFRTSGHRKSHMFSHQRKENSKEKGEQKAPCLTLGATHDSEPTKSSSPTNSFSFPYQQLLSNKLSDKALLNSNDKVTIDGLESVKKSVSSNFLFALDGGGLSYGEQLVESSSGNQQFFLKEVKGDDQTGAAAHFVVTMSDDINSYQDNINDLLESVPHLNGEHSDRFKLDLNIVDNKETLDGDACESCDDCGKKFSSCLELNKHMKKEHLVNNVLSCNVCKQNFRSKTDLDVHVLVHELDQLSCHACSVEFPDEAALRKHKCANEVHDMKSMPTTSLDLTSVVNDFFSFPAL